MGGPGSGYHLPVHIRKIIKHNVSVLEMTTEYIYDLILPGLPRHFTFVRLREVCHKFQTLAGSDWESSYLSGDKTRKAHAGRPFLLCDADKQELESLVRNRCTRRLKDLRDLLYIVLKDEVANIPATSTIFNNLQRLGYSSKVCNGTNTQHYLAIKQILIFNNSMIGQRIKQVHYRQDVFGMLNLLAEMGPVCGRDIVSVDGINFNADDNHAKYGWALRGHEAIAIQISIAGVSYAAMAAMGEEGFIAWSIYNGAVCGTHVADFLRCKVVPRMQRNQIIFLDNAANQKSPEVLSVLNIENQGNYRYNVEYCPELNPIERGFSIVRAWIRANEHEYVGNPLGLIDASFHKHSVAGDLGHMCYHFFDIYRRNHDEWLNSLTA